MKNIKWDKISSLAGIASSLATMVTLLFAVMQIKDSTTSRNADFAYRVKTDFFTAECNNLFLLVDNNLLTYKIDSDRVDSLGLGYFEIDTVKINRLPHLKDLLYKKIYTTYEIDNLIFNHLNELGEYYRKGIISIDYINDGFGYYIYSVHNNQEIQKYLHSEESAPGNSNYFGYQDFQEIYQALVLFRKKQKHVESK